MPVIPLAKIHVPADDDFVDLVYDQDTKGPEKLEYSVKTASTGTDKQMHVRRKLPD